MCMGIAYSKHYGKPDLSYVEAQLVNAHTQAMTLRVHLKVNQNTTRIMDKLRAVVFKCVEQTFHSKDTARDILQLEAAPRIFVRYDEKSIEDKPEHEQLGDDTHLTMLGSINTSIEISAAVRIDDSTKDIFTKLESLLFDTLAKHPDIKKDSSRLGSFFWLDAKTLEERLGKESASPEPNDLPSQKAENGESSKEIVKTKPINWHAVAVALEKNDMEHAFRLIEDTPVDDKLSSFITRNRPSNTQLKAKDREWTPEDAEILIKKIIYFLARNQIGKTNEDIKKVLQLSKN